MLSRREMLRMSAAALLAAGFWPGRASAGDDAPSADFTFVEINDLHYIDKDCGAWLERVVNQIKAQKENPSFCLVVGDLVDNGRAEQLAAVRDIFNGLKLPYYAVPGNHDYLTQDDRKAYDENFPGRLNYYFENQGWHFIGLDSTEGQHSNNTAIQKSALDWLDEQLPKLDRKKPAVLFTHFPLGPAIPTRPINAEKVLDRFKEYNLQAVFNGHLHGYTARKVRDAVITTDRCCALKKFNVDGTKEKGYFVCRAGEGKVSRTFVEVKPA